MTVQDGDVLQAVMEVVLGDGSINQMVFWYAADFVAEQTDSAVRAAMRTNVDAIMNAVETMCPNDWDVNPVKMSRMAFNAVTDQWEKIADLGVETLTLFVPSDNTDPLPNQCSAVMTAATALPKTRGRKFFPAFGEDSQVGGILTSGVLTLMANALANYLADEEISTNNVLEPGVTRTGVDAFRPFTSGVVNDIMGTQRRRKQGVGI